MSAQKAISEKGRVFRDLVARLMSRWGFNYNEAYVYSLLLLSQKPLTINDLVSLTGLSRSAISTLLKKLSREYMVIVRRRGRVKYFSPRIVFVEKFLEQPREMLEREVRPLKDIVSKIMVGADPEYRRWLERIFEELDRLECILIEINKLEKSLKCEKGN
jgi:DNA-binding transcriptional regulator GbsR (MarR family)